MMYMDYTKEIPLLDQNLGLYAVQSFVFIYRWRKQRFIEVPLRDSLATCSPGTDDLIPKGPAFTSYAGWDQLGSSSMHQSEHAGWEQPAP
jgi:hypothetical protein